MAAAAVKKTAKKRDPNNPNTALVVFVVFFTLLSIGLGVWGYYGYAGQIKLKEARDKATKDVDIVKTGQEYHRYLHLEFQMAQGVNLDVDEKSQLETLRAKFFKEGGDFKDEKSRDELKKRIDETQKFLEFDDTAKAYKKSFKDKVEEKDKEINLLRTALAAREDALALKVFRKELDDKRDKEFDFRKEIEDKIKKNNENALAEARKPFADLKEAEANAEKALKSKQDIIDLQKLEMDKLNAQIAKLNLDVKKAVTEAVDPEKEKAIKLENRMPHALLLDISSGKTLWDMPRGKIVRLDWKEKLVYINLGSSSGVKPRLTFNVFAPGWTGKAEKGMKGTIEVFKVLDGATSVATITSLYDSDGYEIPINGPRLQLRREADSPIKEGDLLFNMSWGAHAVIAGPVNWTGLPGKGPADQMRHLHAFVSLLERQGVVVDGYIDVNDGQFKGDITPQTRYLIRGDFINPDTAEGKTKRGQMINEGILDLRRQAIEKGMFIISADNLAMVIGYRQPRSADDLTVGAFRPRIPYSGSDFIRLLEKEKVMEGEKMKEKEKMPPEKEPEKKVEKDM